MGVAAAAGRPDPNPVSTAPRQVPSRLVGLGPLQFTWIVPLNLYGEILINFKNLIPVFFNEL